MYSKHHFLGSVAVAGLAVLVVDTSYPWWALVGLAAAVGVGIDFDHFLVARLNTGSWRAVRRCLRDPRIVFLDQGAIFDAGDVGVLRRLLSHVVLGGLAVVGLALVDGFLAVFVAVVLYVHVLSDLVWDVYEADGLRTPNSPTEE